MTTEARRSMEMIRHAHMALPAAAAAERQGRTHGVVLPAFCLVSYYLCRMQEISVKIDVRKKLPLWTRL